MNGSDPQWKCKWLKKTTILKRRWGKYITENKPCKFQTKCIETVHLAHTTKLFLVEWLYIKVDSLLFV